MFEREPAEGRGRGLIADKSRSSRPGYKFVDVIDPSDQKRFRYTLEVNHALKRQASADPAPRYGITFHDIVDPQERMHWVAASTVRVVEVSSQELLGEFKRYVIEPGQGSGAGQRVPWLFAQGCAIGTSYGTYSTRFFVDQVLKPKKEN